MIILYILIWATLIGSLCIVLLHFAIRNTSFLIRHGLGILLVACFLALIRLFVPVEFPAFQHIIEYPAFISFFLKKRSVFGLFSIEQIIFSILGFVAAIQILKFLHGLYTMKHELQSDSYMDQDSMDILHSIRHDCPLPVKRSRLLKTPVIIGYFSPAIYLPDLPYSDQDLLHILRHEYTHWRCHHLWLKLIVHLCGCFMWWNPLMATFERDISHLIEMICDTIVTHYLNSTDTFNYLEALIHCMKYSADAKEDPFCTAFTLGFITVAPGSSTIQRFEYQLARTDQTPDKDYSHFLLYGMMLLCFLASYYFILQPGYEPDTPFPISGKDNAFLTELQDGSYEFHYGSHIISIPKEDIDAGYYDIYPRISNNE